MAPLKAPSLNEMPLIFFQYFWSTVDKDVTSSILSWLNSGTLPHPINHTFITLISKTNNPEYVRQYRQISLYNVLYKIFSKVLANRLKNILSKIMTEHQSSFTKHRLISNNILVAFETLHCMHKHNSDNIGFMAFKLNMSKAYDRVDWTLLEELIRKMGFNERFITLTMICVKTVTYSILVNREPKGFIQPFKRIRQGNPLSPFLFFTMHRRIEWLHQTCRNEWRYSWLFSLQEWTETNSSVICR